MTLAAAAGRLLCALAFAALLVAGCAGDEDATTTPTVTATPTATAMPNATASPSPAATSTPPTATPTAVATPSVGAAFPDLPLDQITDLQVLENLDVVVTSVLAPDAEDEGATLCGQLLAVALFSPDPRVIVLANDGTTQLAECSAP